MTKVVIVEDHAMVRDALANLLGKHARFHVVGVAGNVKEALALVQASAPDVIMADLSLDDGNAIDLLRALKRDHSEIPTLIVTGFRDEFSASEALNAGAAGYVFKHQSTAEILEAIDKVAAGETYVSDAVRGLVDSSQGAKRHDVLSGLTRREQEIFHLVVRGSLSKAIAQHFGLSVKTIDTHRTNINRKLGVRSTAALIRFAAAHGVDLGKP